MIELIKDLIDGYRERIKNPFIFSFIITFFAYNWRPILILTLSTHKIEDRIYYIQDKYLSYSVVIVPIILALIYSIILPYLSVLILYLINKANEVQMNKVKQKRISTLNQKIEEAKLERIIAEEIAGRKEKEELNATIEQLNNELQLKSSHMNEIKSSQTDEINKLKERLKKTSEENTFIKNTLENSKNENEYIRNVHSLMVDLGKTAERRIKLFLKSNLSDEEVIHLKESAKVNTKPVSESIINYNNVALMIKAKLLRKTENTESYYITEIGKRFIDEL